MPTKTKKTKTTTPASKTPKLDDLLLLLRGSFRKNEDVASREDARMMFEEALDEVFGAEA